MTPLLEKIDAMLDDENQGIDISQLRELVKLVESYRKRIYRLEQEIAYSQKQLCGELAIKIRQKLPSLNVGVGNSQCKVGYKSQTLYIKPDIRKGIWVIESRNKKFSNGFYKNYSSKTVLNDSLEDVALAIVDYFRSYYKSLGENIVGEGKIVLDEKYISLPNLILEFRSGKEEKK